MGWFSEISNRKDNRGENLKGSKEETKKSSKLGILSFETAKTMSSLISLYRSLSDEEIYRVKNEVLGSQGIAYLNSTDTNFLLSLACAEKLEDLENAANLVTRLNQKCGDYSLDRFDDIIYSHLKNFETIDFRKLEYGSRKVEKMVEKMEKLTRATSILYSAVDGLTEFEVSGKKQNSPKQFRNANTDFRQKKYIRHYRESSLWNQSFNKSIEMIARIVCVVYVRIYDVFASCIDHKRNIAGIQPEPRKIITGEKVIKEQSNYYNSRSGPIPIVTKPNIARFHSHKVPIIKPRHQECRRAGGIGNEVAQNTNRVFHAAGPSTVGGSGLALRYANLIVFMEKQFDTEEPIDSGRRLYLYEMLPENMKNLVKSKLSKKINECRREQQQDELLAKGWKDALMEIFRWLAPMAHNTIKWHVDRNPEKMKFGLKPAVMLFQTLHFSDKEKTEAAIVEVLVALSCIFRYESYRTC